MLDEVSDLGMDEEEEEQEQTELPSDQKKPSPKINILGGEAADDA